MVSSSAAVLERLGAYIDPRDFDRLVADALEEILPARALADPRSRWQRRLPDRRRVLSALLVVVALVLVVFLVNSFIHSLLAPVAATAAS